MGDRGRLVVPVEVRTRRGLHEGDRLVMIDGPQGLVLLTREQALSRVRDDLAGSDLVGELIAERRESAVRERAKDG